MKQALRELRYYGRRISAFYFDIKLVFLLEGPGHRYPEERMPLHKSHRHGFRVRDVESGQT